MKIYTISVIKDNSYLVHQLFKDKKKAKEVAERVLDDLDINYEHISDDVYQDYNGEEVVFYFSEHEV